MSNRQEARVEWKGKRATMRIEQTPEGWVAKFLSDEWESILRIKTLTCQDAKARAADTWLVYASAPASILQDIVWNPLPQAAIKN